ncbi:MAG: TIGR00730 family Rossman fold protein [Gemmatimonadota bacterium]|nr:TIGR00730 family Rossman fold protein [Gemmatimonadota bacterium]
MNSRVAVYCGANAGNSPRFADAARELGNGLARKGIGVVYGGASRGLMGILADAALAAGGEVIGVLPRSLGHREIAHPAITELRLVDTMHERKALILELSDAVAVLPGGIGTLDEFFEAFTWAQIGLHHKPIALIDVNGFYQPLLAHLRNMVAAGFLSAERMETLRVCGDALSFTSTVANTISTGAAQATPPRYAALSIGH